VSGAKSTALPSVADSRAETPVALAGHRVERRAEIDRSRFHNRAARIERDLVAVIIDGGALFGSVVQHETRSV